MEFFSSYFDIINVMRRHTKKRHKKKKTRKKRKQEEMINKLKKNLDITL